MGGYGSGKYQQINARPTNEQSYKLPMSALRKAHALEWGKESRGTFRIDDLQIIYQVTCNVLTLSYFLKNGSGACSIPLIETTPNYGGVRIWFLCLGCIHRCAVLYLAPGQRKFQCHKCSDLAYQSSRKKKKRTPDDEFQARLEARVRKVNALLAQDKHR